MKILIIRLSSIGDIIQCMSVVGGFKNKFSDCELHWIVRKDMASLLKIDPRIDKIWEFDRSAGVSGLIKMAFELRKENYSHIYDAHSNIRSNILKSILIPFGIGPKLITRHKSRFKRFLLFNFGINKLPWPFRAFESFRSPLKKWGLNDYYTDSDNWVFPDEINKKTMSLIGDMSSKTITLVPSAAWELKRWPVDYWIKLIDILSDFNFIILAGPQDSFAEEIKKAAPDRVINLAGKTSLLESFCVTYYSNYVISGDTGFLHAADLFNKPGMAIIGPTAFGFPSGEKMKIIDVDLPCRPCSKHGNTKCKLTENKKCLKDITPEFIAETARKNYPN